MSHLAAGFTRASWGVVKYMDRKHSITSRSSSASWARAHRWSTALVEPLMLLTTRTAFWIDAGVRMSRAQIPRRARSHTARPDSKASCRRWA